MDTPDQPNEQDADLAEDPAPGAAPDDAAEAAPEEAEPGRPANGPLALGVLAAIAAAAVFVAISTIVVLKYGPEQEKVGIMIVAGLAVGYALRRLSGRSSTGVRVLAGVVTTLACVAEAITASRAAISYVFKIDFFPRLTNYDYGQTFELIRTRGWAAQLMYGAAIVMAFLSAGPQKPPKSKAARDEPEPIVVPESD